MIREIRELSGNLISVMEIRENSGKLMKVWKKSGNLILFSNSFKIKTVFFVILNCPSTKSIVESATLHNLLCL